MGERRKKQLAGEVAVFLQSFGRKAPRRGEPNDRSYDRELEAKIKRMLPEEMDTLLRDDLVDDGSDEPSSDVSGLE